VRAGLSEDTLRRIEQATGRLATQSIARMDERLPWFRELPADQRSWVTLVAQAGLQSFVEWLRSPDDVLDLTGEVFAAAPSAMARVMSLLQTVEMVRETIAVAERQLPALAAPSETATVREELLRFSREIAFAAAGVYARAAESRGSWDDRLEALVIDGLVSGIDVGDPLPSQLAALGWHGSGPVAAVVGTAPDGGSRDSLGTARALPRRLGMNAVVGLHGDALILLLGGVQDPLPVATKLLPAFGDGPVVVGPAMPDLADAGTVTRTALSGLRASAAWPDAPRPVSAEALLPERVLAGDLDARAELLAAVYRPLVAGGPVLVQTVTCFLDTGGALESSARALFVHPNTVRYRLRRVAELCGQAPTEARGAFVLRLALAIGRLEDAS
jgi:hypothetical protein